MESVKNTRTEDAELSKKTKTNEEVDNIQNILSEMLLLGNIMNSPELIKAYENVLSVEDFSDACAKELYYCLQEYAKLFPGEAVEETHFNCMLLNLFENRVKLKYIRPKGGWKTARDFMRMGVKSNPDNEAYKSVKKYALLRRVEDSGYNVDKILKKPDFRDMTVADIQQMITTDVDERLEVAKLRVSEDFGTGMTHRMLSFFNSPEIGYQTPFDFLNHHLHGLYKNDFTLIGGLSNTGKGRFLMTLLVWLVVMEGQTVCLMSNEMTGDDFFKCLLCTLVNNEALHGKKLRLTQTDIVQTRFKDQDGRYIERMPEESIEDFQAKVQANSSEFQELLMLTQWWEANFTGKFHFVQVADDYSTARLKKEIQLAKSKGCTVIAYDTLKAYQSSEWEDLVQASTDLSEMIKSDPDGLVGLATFQLTEDAMDTSPENLSQKNISRAKGIYHLADNMLMFVPLSREHKYAYEVWNKAMSEEYGESVVESIKEEQSIVAFRIVKNRRGGGKDETYAVQTNLDRNLWVHVGELQRKKKWSA